MSAMLNVEGVTNKKGQMWLFGGGDSWSCFREDPKELTKTKDPTSNQTNQNER